MDNATQISIPLKRKLKSGNAYTKSLPKVSCTAVNLGDGNNNTIEGVEFMAEWIKKYAWQTKKLTEKLFQEGKISKTDLPKTVRGLYNFLYSHVQYAADGKLQQLRSPACAWEQRKTGVDCKSYTIFAMSILQNLGITAAIRQVKQPGFFPEQFTHVYVVVPENQNTKNEAIHSYWVIDATKHNNTEGLFVTAKDKIMEGLQYQGLNAAATGTATVSQEAYDNFRAFLKELLAMGVSAEKVSAIKKHINSLVSAGINPHIQFTEAGLLIRKGEGVPGVFYALPERNNTLSAKGGESNGEGTKIDWGGIINGVSGFFSDIFGGCGNASWPPEKGTATVRSKINSAKSILGPAPYSNSRFQKYENYMRGHIIEYGTVAPPSYHSCSKETLLKMGAALEDSFNNVFSQLKNLYYTESVGNKKVSPFSGLPGNHINNHAGQFQYTQHKLKGLKPGQSPNQSVNVDAPIFSQNPNPGNNNTGNNNPGNTNTGNNNSGNQWSQTAPDDWNTKEASANNNSSTLLYGGLALGGLLLFWPRIAKTIAPKPIAPKAVQPKKTMKK